MSESNLWFQSAIKDDIHTILQLQSQYARTCDKNGWTALMHAAFCNSINTIQQLLKRECQMQTQQGMTALMLAAIRGNLQAVRLLYPHENNLALRSDTADYPAGATALLMAASLYNRDVVDVLHQAESKTSLWSPLHKSAFFRDSHAVLCQTSLQTQTDALGRTPMFYACMGPYSEEQMTTVKALERLTPKTSPDAYGMFPPHYAAAFNNVSLGYYFVTQRCVGMYFSHRTDYQQKLQAQLNLRTAPVLASKITKQPLLLQFGTGMTPLHVACCCGSRAFVQKLSSAFIREETTSGVTALMLAAAYNCVDVSLKPEQFITTKMTALGLRPGSSVFDVAGCLGSSTTIKLVNDMREEETAFQKSFAKQQSFTRSQSASGVQQQQKSQVSVQFHPKSPAGISLSQLNQPSLTTNIEPQFKKLVDSHLLTQKRLAEPLAAMDKTIEKMDVSVKPEPQKQQSAVYNSGLATSVTQSRHSRIEDERVAGYLRPAPKPAGFERLATVYGISGFEQLFSYLDQQTAKVKHLEEDNYSFKQKVLTLQQQLIEAETARGAEQKLQAAQLQINGLYETNSQLAQRAAQLQQQLEAGGSKPGEEEFNLKQEIHSLQQQNQQLTANLQETQLQKEQCQREISAQRMQVEAARNETQQVKALAPTTDVLERLAVTEQRCLRLEQELTNAREAAHVAEEQAAGYEAECQQLQQVCDKQVAEIRESNAKYRHLQEQMGDLEVLVGQLNQDMK